MANRPSDFVTRDRLVARTHRRVGTDAPTVVDKPAAGAKQPTAVIARPAAVTAKPPVTAKPAPVAAKSAPVTAKPTPVAAKPAPVTTKPTPVTAKPAPVTAKPAPVTAKPTPDVAGEEPPVNRGSEPRASGADGKPRAAKEATARPGAPAATTSSAMPRAAGSRLPSPTRRPRPQPVTAPAANRLSIGGPTQTTAIAAPPPPPITIAASTSRAADQEATEIVKPLPSPARPASKDAPERSRSPRVIVDPAVAGADATAADGRAEVRRRTGRFRITRVRAAIGAAAVIATVLVVAIGFSSDDVRGAPALEHRELSSATGSSPASPQPAAAVQAIAPAAATPTEPPATTSSTTEVAVRSPDEAAVAAGEALGASPPPRVTRPHVRSRSASGAAAGGAIRDSGRAAKPAGAPRGKPTRPLAYDPDALFLKKPRAEAP
jgi:hypothetical protein